jgi:UDP-2-acetamido-3-amino-2,3-dideoxy-glucuronate N-acetyltransferase
MQPSLPYTAHPTACIDLPCTIGPGTKIWHFCHVMAGSHLGAGCTLGQNVFVGSDVHIGDRVKIQNNVSVYSGTLVEDDVFLGPSCVLTNVRNPRAAFSHRAAGVPFERTTLRRGCTIGANATIVCGHTVGAHALVAAGSTVCGDVLPHALVMGVPARQVGWVGFLGYRLEQHADGTWVCPRSDQRYTLLDGVLSCQTAPTRQAAAGPVAAM